MDHKKIQFLDKEYDKLALEAMETEKLLELRNLVASNLGVATIKSFKDHESGVSQTWKALERFEEAGNEEASGEEPKEKKTRKPRERKPKAEGTGEPRGPAKSSSAKPVKRPTRKMFATLKKIGEHDGTQGRQHRWKNYHDGMTLADVIETDGCEPWDVYNWQKHGIMAVTEPTEEEYRERRAAWFKKHGREDPDLVKAEEKRRKAEEKAEAESQEEPTADAVTAPTPQDTAPAS